MPTPVEIMQELENQFAYALGVYQKHMANAIAIAGAHMKDTLPPPTPGANVHSASLNPPPGRG